MPADNCKLADRLTYDPAVCPDGPIVRGTTIAADAIVSAIVDTDSYARILDRYPELTREDVDACLQFEAEFRGADAIGGVPGGFAPPADDGDDRLDALDSELGAGLADTGAAPEDVRRFASGAVRSKAADTLDFASLPLVGLIGVARTAAEGGTKYGRWNYALGMEAHECVNHALRHLVLWMAGDRSEPHLEHASWNCLAASQSAVLHPEINAPHCPGPGLTITPAIRDHLEAGKAERDARRRRGEFDTLGEWSLRELPEVARLLEQRRAVEKGGAA